MAYLQDVLNRDYIAYGGIHAHDNSTVQSIPSGATYTKVINFDDNDPSNNTTPDFANNQITVDVAGIYKIDAAISFTASNNIVFFGSLFVDGVEIDSIHFTRKIGTAGDVGNSTFSGLISLTAAQVLDFRTRHNDVSAINATFSYMNLSCVKVDVT